MYKYYAKNSKHNKILYYLFQIVIIVVSTIIPIVNVSGMTNNDLLKITTSILGGTAAISTSAVQLLKSHESWIIQRATANALIGEKYRFLQGAGIYSTLQEGERATTFVDRVESIITQESTKFFAVHTQKYEFTTKPSTTG